ncbi:glycosyltransferase family 2 protein [Enterococcus sp. AZ072]|uniref:glycosyltransferase family 2 protein n=1 Tax=unclassified Enterococcus TaxID=2608891 RepID=UPI003D2D7088
MQKRIKLLMIVAIVSQVIYLSYRLFFTLAVQYNLISLLISLLLFVAELTSNMQGVSDFFGQLFYKDPMNIEELPAEFFPEVDVFIITHDEDIELLQKTINGCKTMDYPDQSKVHIYLCDDGLRPAVKNICEKWDIGYIGLDPQKNKHKKAGNINHALQQTSSPLVAFLDCDMIPKSNYLKGIVPHFYQLGETDYDTYEEYQQGLIDQDYNYPLAYVQSAQDFYTFDLFQYNLYAQEELPKEQTYFFQTVNPSRNESNAPIFCGSNAIVSRKALENVDGMATDSITEDLSTSLVLLKAGYKTKAIPESYAYGMNPTAIEGLKIQRERWARGFIKSIRSHNFFTSSVALRTKLAYLHSYNYWFFPIRRLVFMFIPAFTVIFQLKIVIANPLVFLIIWGTSYMIYNLALKQSSSKKVSATYANITDHILTPLIIKGLLEELIGISQTDFLITPKTYEKQFSKYYGIVLFYLINLGLNVFAIWLLFSKYWTVMNIFSIGILAYWSLKNIIYDIFAMSFMRQRDNISKEFTMWKQSLNLKTGNCSTQTIKVNEQFIYLDKLPNEIEPDEIFTFEVGTDKYPNVQLLGRTNLKKKNGVYELTILNKSDEDYYRYLNILHDQDTTYINSEKNARFWVRVFLLNLTNLLTLRKEDKSSEDSLSDNSVLQRRSDDTNSSAPIN